MGRSKAASALGDWPLVGRSSDVVRVLDAVVDARCSGVVVTGAAGVGKSRLVGEAAWQLSLAGWPTRWLAVCGAGADTPLAALAEFVHSHDNAGLRAGMRSAAVGLRELSRTAGRRVVLVVDGADLLDEASTAVLHGLARDGVVAVLLGLSGAVRIPTRVQGLADDPTMTQVDLGPLDRADVGQLATEVLGAPISSVLVQELWQLSRGLPRVVRALLCGGHQDGLLTMADGRWRHTAPLAASTGVQALVAPELERLTDPERTAVELVSLAGGAELDLIAWLVGDEPLASLEECGIVEVEESGARVEAQIADALLSGSVLGGLTRSRRRWLARHLADALEATGRQRGDDAQRAARWRLDSGRRPDTDALLQASEGARARLELEVAERLARTAFRQRRCWRSHLHLARSLSLLGETNEADRLLMAGTQYADADDARLRLAIARADNLLFSAGQPRSAVAVVSEARTSLMGTDASAELASRAAIALSYDDDPEGCVRLAAQLPPVARTAASTRPALALAHGLARLVEGDVAGALSVAEAVLDATVGVPSETPVMDLRLRQLRVRALLLLGRIADAEQVARADHDTALADATEQHAATSAALLGLVLLQRGQLRPASDLLADACGSLRARDPLSLLAVCLAARAYAAALLGDTAAGATLLEEARQQFAPLQPLTAWAGRADCWLLAQQGSVTAAAEVAISVAADARGPMLWRAEVLHDVARLGHADTAEPLDALARASDSDLITTMAAHASSLAEADPHALMAVADRFTEIGADLPAAEAQAQAVAILRGTGHPGQGHHAAARAAVLAERCGDVATPALTEDLARLTAREREVALLAAEGLRSREVARQLTVSVRTVDNHLRRVYAKFGITGRAELARALRVPEQPGAFELAGATRP